MALRHYLFSQLDPGAREGLSFLNKLTLTLIVISVGCAILETEPTLRNPYRTLFLTIEWILTSVFAIEYLARVWVSIEDPRYGNGWRGRLKYVFSPFALIDLMALLPVFFAGTGADSFILRIARLLRILRLARLGRFSKALADLGRAVAERREELFVSIGCAVMVLIASASIMYFVEGRAQPEAFGSIPRAMWWSIATLTTVGYGDVYPITVLGRMCAAVTAITGIGLIAMPTGILAAALSDVAQRRNRDNANDDS